MTTTMTMPTTLVPFASPGVRRITVDEYERIILSGAIRDPDRVELIDGYMVDKMGKSAEHGYSTRKTIDGLGAIIGPGWTWRSEQPVRIPDYDEPEPDVTIVRGSTDDYAHRIPGPDDVGLLVEISLTTLETDQGKKRSSYATDRVPVYWIVNLVARQIEVYTDPGPGAYGSTGIFVGGQMVPVVLDGQQLGLIAVDDILPPARPAAGGNGA